MACCTVLETKNDMNVGMGQIGVAQGPTQLKAVLGSCVAVALHSPRHHAGALAHVVLPDSNGRNQTPGKFADTAIPAMLAALAKIGVPSSALVAKIAGGASMFGTEGPLQIGVANVEAVTETLKAARLPVAGEDTSGKKGRRVTLNCANGEFIVETVGNPPKTL